MREGFCHLGLARGLVGCVGCGLGRLEDRHLLLLCRRASAPSAVGRAALYEIPFEAKSITIAENLGEAPNEKSPHGFNQTITRISHDLTGQPAAAERTFFQKLGLRRR